MIATAVMTIAVVGFTGAFLNIQKAVQFAKNKTLASNLAQEQIQVLTQKVYYEVLVSPATNVRSDVNPPILYDTAYFPPETVLEGAVRYTRYTYVQVVTESAGNIMVLPPSTPDTGMRLITVSVVWNSGSEVKQVVVNTVMTNPSSVMTASRLNGTVTDQASGNPVPGAVIDLAENMGWRAVTGASGGYSINMAPGNFTLVASGPGYFKQFIPISIAANAVQTQNVALQQISSGTVRGTAWINDRLLISQIVASTVQADMSGFVAQYIELYNPTPNAISIDGAGPPDVRINYSNSPGDHDGRTCAHATWGIKLAYNNTSVASHAYYIVANTGTFTVNGIVTQADAVYADNADAFCSVAPSNWDASSTPKVKQIVDVGHGGAVWLSDSAGDVIDSVGFVHNGHTHAQCAPNCIQLPSGFDDGIQIVRASSPSYVGNSDGRAYDTNMSSIDFIYTSAGAGLPYRPFGSATAQLPVAGRPAVGAIVTATDGLSNPATAYSVGSPPRADFVLVGVATAAPAYPWTVVVSSGGVMFESDTVVIPSQGYVYSFPSSTTFIDQAATLGVVSGRVTDVLGLPIASPVAIPVTGGGASANASVVNGRYMLRVPGGSIDVTANSGGANQNYVSISSLAVTVNAGQVSDGVDFVLPQGGQITGFVTRDGINPLPGVTVSALDANNYARDTQVSDAAGRFTTIIISTGLYRIAPQLDSLETSTPTWASLTLAVGQTAFSSTFTVTGALGSVSGRVSQGGQPISTGVLIVLTTSTLAGTPPALPALSSASLTGASYYTASSREDGTYSIDVRQSTSPAYRLYGYYSTVSSTGGVVIQAQTLTGVQVLAGQSVTGQDLAW